MINGIINIYKEKGYTSHDVVAKLRGILKQKKIGHTGTLDPDAEGVLPVCLGKATKLCDLLTDKDKTYETVLKLGITTDSQDTTGKILKEQRVTSSKEEIKEVILGFIGDYEQIPPMFSALKVNGKKLYELAREGIEIERKARNVHIHHIEIVRIDEDEIKMVVSCSKGTYIRTLCHDIGEKLGCGGCMKNLVRTKVSRFVIEDSLKLSDVEKLRDGDKLGPHIIKIEDMFLDYSKVMVSEEYTKFIYNGNKINKDMLLNNNLSNTTKQIRVYDCLEQFIGLYELMDDGNIYKPVKMFL
ncbi:tRNA pseudouridine55 synthase [Mobilisporobacter senegalensis]|uniref:tRNA pseudouridine synthase B n=1 Tax=Mobilisporobacter senegalensis TaxID=1329262 RepID=A0A3N1XW53_9FIRM|nr:tRNA pseudouridine(55) synthase TruB [Mobilisporobacter senegalensis]ROR30823.1 tRNA pseudouridine55 synthase [Mobilisporobacter senegalensis]